MKPFQTYLSKRTKNEYYSTQDLPRGLDQPKSFLYAFHQQGIQVQSKRQDDSMKQSSVALKK